MAWALLCLRVGWQLGFVVGVFARWVGGVWCLRVGCVRVGVFACFGVGVFAWGGGGSVVPPFLIALTVLWRRGLLVLTRRVWALLACAVVLRCGSNGNGAGQSCPAPPCGVGGAGLLRGVGGGVACGVLAGC